MTNERLVVVGITGLGLGFEFAGLGRLDGMATNASISVGGLRGRFELARLGGEDGFTRDTSVGSGGGDVAFELTRLDGTIVTEGGHLGGSGRVTLVSGYVTRLNLGGTEGTLGQDGISNLSVLLLGGAGRAPDVARVLLERLQVQNNAATTALEAELVVGVIVRLNGLEGVGSFAAFGAVLGGHV